MRNKETLKFISNNIKGCKTKIFILSLCQIVLGALVVAFSFSIRYIIRAIEVGSKTNNNQSLIKWTIVMSCIAFTIVVLQIFYRIYYE